MAFAKNNQKVSSFPAPLSSPRQTLVPRLCAESSCKLSRLLTVGFLVAFWSAPVTAQADTFAGFLAEWDRPAVIEGSLSKSHALDTVWARSLVWNPATSALAYTESQAMRMAKGRSKAKPEFRYGAVLHNALEGKGFDSNLGMSMCAQKEVIAGQLKSFAEREGLKAINLDLESLPADAGPQFEAFIDTMITTFKGSDVRLSVSLHAQKAESTPFEGARFQRWQEIAKRNIDVVIMAYDHAWSASPPGPIAPLAWVIDVTKHALAVFGEKKLIIALPLYGYEWRGVASGGVDKPGAEQILTWQGEPELAPLLQQKLEGAPHWKKDAGLKAADGTLAWDGPRHALAFDDSTSVLAKWKHLKSIGAKRLAVWRLGGETQEFHKSLRQLSRGRK